MMCSLLSTVLITFLSLRHTTHTHTHHVLVCMCSHKSNICVNERNTVTFTVTLTIFQISGTITNRIEWNIYSNEPKFICFVRMQNIEQKEFSQYLLSHKLKIVMLSKNMFLQRTTCQMKEHSTYRKSEGAFYLFLG